MRTPFAPANNGFVRGRPRPPASGLREESWLSVSSNPFVRSSTQIDRKYPIISMYCYIFLQGAIWISLHVETLISDEGGCHPAALAGHRTNKPSRKCQSSKKTSSARPPVRPSPSTSRLKLTYSHSSFSLSLPGPPPLGFARQPTSRSHERLPRQDR